MLALCDYRTIPGYASKVEHIAPRNDAAPAPCALVGESGKPPADPRLLEQGGVCRHTAFLSTSRRQRAP
jgi:hypothetical protein